MSLTDEEMLSYVVERDVDLGFVQLVKTAPEFRNWFLEELDVNNEIDQFLGVRHSVDTHSGESDVEIGVETAAGTRHLVLVENKIDASLQERQAERYFERGADYLEHAEWDDFTVALIAPSEYVSRTHREDFRNVITYEAIIDQLEASTYQGSPFIKTLFQEAIAKRTAAIDPIWIDEIERRFVAAVDESHPLEVYQSTNKQFRVESTHPDHPYHVLYNVYLPGDSDGERAIVRINLGGRNDGAITDDEFEAIRPILFGLVDKLEGFPEPENSKNPVCKQISRSQFTTDDAYLSSIVETLVGLITVSHPALVRQRPVVELEYEDRGSMEFEAYDVEEYTERYVDADQNTIRTAYWIVYGPDPDVMELVPDDLIHIADPDSEPGHGGTEFPILCIPKDSNITVKTPESV